MHIIKNKINLNKKSNASLAGTIIILMTAFLIFCILSIDVGYVVTVRYKAQKTTETIALYMASFLSSLPDSEKQTESLNPVKEQFENLYSDYNLNSYYKFEITDIETKFNEGYPVKVKITTETSVPALFLRYTGIGILKIMQTSYAASYSSNLTQIDSDDKSYTFRANKIITDKKGDDIKIEYNRNYFVFAGLKKDASLGDNGILWVDLGSSGNDDNKEHYIFSNTSENYDAWCISKENTGYDFSSGDNTIGLVQYIKIIKTDICNTSGEEITEAEEPPVVTSLNSVKIIKRRTFLNEDF